MNIGCFSSKRGKDRCRHFVITCQQNGHYVISGDPHTHHSLVELISYYQTSEIEPFGENLTVACSKEEDRSVYDEISWGQPTSAKQSATVTTPVLTRQISGSSPITKPSKETTSHQPSKPRGEHQGPQKSLSNEWRTLSSEETNSTPPGPERRSLLTSFEEDFGGEGNVGYSELKMPKVPHKASSDTSQEPEGPGQANSSSCRKKINTAYAPTKQLDRLYSEKVSLAETSGPETIYSEIGLNQDLSGRVFPETQSGPSPLLLPKKATLGSPASTPPRLSPKLPNKPNVPLEPQGSETPLATSTTSLVTDKDCHKPSQAKSLSGSPRETLYGQVHKLKSHHSIVSSDDNKSDTYEQIPFVWMKSIPREQDPERIPKSLPTKPKDFHEPISAKTGRSLKTQVYAENPDERIPSDLPKCSSSSRNARPVENTYEQIHFGPAKETEGKGTQKVW
uniref:SH2 domain-containing protein 7 n=1 Tax=Pogona vitticeps TaxID=103695 RepID=A0ABM5EY81_9SAUR